MAFVVLIYLPLTVAAWIKIGPIAGTVAVVWLVFMLYISSRPGASLFGPGPYSSAGRARSDDGPADASSGPTESRGA